MSFMRRNLPGIGAAAGRCSEVPNGFPARVRRVHHRLRPRQRKETAIADEDRLIIEHVDPERWESGERFGFPAAAATSSKSSTAPRSHSPYY
jgi:hypothetical protein